MWVCSRRPRHAGHHVVVAAILVLLVVVAPASAQSAPSSTLSLQAAVDRALAANPTIAAARLTTAVTQADVDVARERPNPEFSAEFERETPKQSFGVALPIELGGKRAGRIAVGLAAAQASDADVAVTVADVRAKVRQAYADVQIAEARLQQLEELRDLAVRMRDAAGTRFDRGDVPRLEVVEADLALAVARNDAEGARGDVTAARTRFNALLGQPLATAQTLSTPLDAARAVSLDTALALADGNRTIAALDRRVDEQRARVALARALRTPDLVPSVTFTRDSQPDFDYGWRAGLSLTLPLVTSHRAGVRLEQATLDQRLAERAAVAVGVTTDVTASVATVEAHRLRYARYRDEILPQAAEVETLAQDAYSLGQTGITVLLQALQASRDVRLRALDTLAEWQTALVDLERAIGAPLP